MDERTRGTTPEEEPAPGPESDAPTDTDTDDLECHSATIYRRRRGPYPLRHGAPLPDADDRSRGERQPPPHRASA
jgi:hypothetical protein